jgi:hypothetical protein
MANWDSRLASIAVGMWPLTESRSDKPMTNKHCNAQHTVYPGYRCIKPVNHEGWHSCGFNGETIVEDEQMGLWVYCKEHVGPHSTGWCSVSTDDKIALKAKDRDEAVAECRAMNLPIHGEE